ncbi:glycoside hydrolase family 18 protein [Pseudalkalibacillus sp. SCS-8]|uniref:glycoside hydrolase family 18 protein n=1 Tax=Pseudalkalibacillus nanhaiensis TaxID=3115291 RepID=UPI0032DB5226
MKNQKLLLMVMAGVLALIVAVFTVTAADSDTKSVSEKKVVGYYGGWAAYSGFDVLDIEAEKLTHLNYAFAKISDDGKVALGNPEVDVENLKQLQKLKAQHPDLRTLISVGGWSHSENFSDVAATEASRKAFADSTVTFIEEHGFDGIDIDWEYPVSGGESDNKHRPEDKENFTKLMEEIRKQLDQHEQQTGKKYTLTIAGAASTSFLEKTEMAQLVSHVDFINLMTYDINGQWYKKTGHNAPLYTTSGDAPNKWSAEDTVNAYFNAGVPKEKMVLGIPFYGRKYDAVTPLNNGLHQPFVLDGGSVTYDGIKDKHLNKEGYKRFMDDETKVPYLWNGTSFISYEDPESIQHKTDYIQTENLGGAMVWELSHDRKGVLLKAVYDGLQPE